MIRIIATLLVTFAAIVAVAHSQDGLQVGLSPISPDQAGVAIVTVTKAHRFILGRADGKQIIIDFSGDAVTITGDLPVTDGAKIFFDAVMREKMCR